MPAPSIGNSAPKFIVGANHDRGHIQKAGATEKGVHRNLGYHYTSTGYTPGGLSPSRLLNSTLRWVTLSTPFSKLGNAIQGGYDSQATATSGKARYWTGAIIKGCANITGGAAGLVSGTLATGTAITTNIVGGLGRGVAGSFVGLGGWIANKQEWKSKALDLMRTSFIRKNEQTPLNAKGAENVMDRAQLARITSSTSYREMPKGFQTAKIDEIPGSILARGAANSSTGEDAKLRAHTAIRSTEHGGPIDSDPFVLTGDAWSALKVCVFKTTAEPPKFVLSFAGTELKDGRLATIKSDFNQTFGIKDTAFEDAERVVKAFADKYGEDNIEIVGHSLGGALAQYAGIKHGVKVTAFNSMGLSVSLRDRLGAKRINEANVTHINSSGDSLSQGVENGRLGITASSQVGKRYVIDVDHKKGHKMESITDGLEKTILQTVPVEVPPVEIQNTF
jgi:hypothetical protein